MVDRFDKDDTVRVGDEDVLSRVVLPSYCKPRPEDIPENMPPIEVCCVPVALVATIIEGDEHMRWVDLHELTRVHDEPDDIATTPTSDSDSRLVGAFYPEAGGAA